MYPNHDGLAVFFRFDTYLGYLNSSRLIELCLLLMFVNMFVTYVCYFLRAESLSSVAICKATEGQQTVCVPFNLASHKVFFFPIGFVQKEVYEEFNLIYLWLSLFKRRLLQSFAEM